VAQRGVVWAGVEDTNGTETAMGHAVARGRTILHGALLTKGKGLSTVELCALLELAHALLALLLVVLVMHLDVALREALGTVAGKELAVATFENVHLGEGKLGVLKVVDSTVAVADELGHARGTEFRVFTVEDQESVGSDTTVLEQILGQLVLVVVVDGTVDVATVVLVLETAVNNQDLIVVRAVVAIKDVDERVLLDARKAIRLFLVEEVRKLLLVGLVEVHRDGRRRVDVRVVVLLAIDDIVGVLKHAKRTTNLLPRRRADGGRLADLRTERRAIVAAERGATRGRDEVRLGRRRLAVRRRARGAAEAGTAELECGELVFLCGDRCGRV
jgi:hypothetical protein